MAASRAPGPIRGSAIRGWTTQLGAAMLRHQRPQRSTGIIAAVVSVAIATLAIFFLRKIAPVVSLSVVYLPAVLLIATFWGIALGLLTSLLSAASFNFFHIPPTGEFTIVDGRNWVALAAFTIVALFASALAELARIARPGGRTPARRGRSGRRARPRAAPGRGHPDGPGQRGAAGGRGAGPGVGGDRARPHPSGGAGPAPHPSPPPDPRRMGLPLHGIDGEQMATLLVGANLPPDTEERLRTQVVPTLEALVAIAQRRDAMQAELVETAALRRSDDIKTALLRTVSHDLRTPLTAVVAAGHALGADSLTDQERSELSTAVVEEGNRLAGLVDNLLALSRLQAGSATPRSDWVSIEDLVSAAAEGLHGDPLDVRVTVEPDVPEVRADAAQLERAFANLLENAGRYAGGAPIVVHARRGGGPAGEVVVSITDRGPGSTPPSRSGSSSPSTGAQHALAGVDGLRVGPGHRQGLRRGQRRVDHRPVAPRAGDQRSTCSLPMAEREPAKVDAHSAQTGAGSAGPGG